jgi:hypothetical protein
MDVGVRMAVAARRPLALPVLLAVGIRIARKSRSVYWSEATRRVLDLLLAQRERRPDEPAAFQPLGVERHAKTIVPENLDQLAAFPAEHLEIAAVRFQRSFADIN